METQGGIGRGMRGFFSGMLWGVSNPREGSEILIFLYRSPLVCRARSYISYARGRGVLRTSALRSSTKLALKMCTYGDLGSGSSQLVQEGARPPEALGEYGSVLPYAYAQVVLEAEGSPRREHHAVFFGEPDGELEGGHVELVAQEGQQSFM
jgi:hypothetical protein